MGIPFFNVYDRKLNAHAVDSRRYNLTNNETGEVTKGKALQWRLDPNCPRGIYQRTKRRVQAIRRNRIQRSTQEHGLREFLRGTSSQRPAVSEQHARTAGVQPEHAAVPGVQGLGIQDSTQG